MALPSNGPISLDTLRAEFGATGAKSLADFYRGGAWVPNIPAYANVPTSGPISLANFYSTGLRVSVSPISEIFFAAEPAPLTRSFNAYSGVSVAGGSVSTATWTHISGPAVVVSNPNILNPLFSATLYKNTSLNSVYRLTVTSGAMTATADLTIYWEYWTDQ